MTATYVPIRLGSEFDAYLQQCNLYDQLNSAIAVVDAQGILRYENLAFMQFNKTVRDSIENLPRYGSLLECPEIQTFLQTPLTASHA
jgi:hypothetical protein